MGGEYDYYNVRIIEIVWEIYLNPITFDMDNRLKVLFL